MSDSESIGLHNLPKPAGATSQGKRKGRGPGSGVGKTAGRGHKGQRSRSGGGVRPGFEGGQMPLIRRVPKRGFRNIFRDANQVVNLKDLEQLDGTEVTPDSLQLAGLVARADSAVKILGVGEASRAYSVRRCAASASAREKIVKAGGTIEA